MYISKIQISGYRKFKEGTSIDFFHTDKSDGSNTTTLVGANNSGKTSIVELCEAIFSYRNDMRKIPFTIQDFAIQDFEKWLDNCADDIYQFLKNNSLDTLYIASIANKLKDLFDRKRKDIPCIEILIDIEFSEDEDIRNIADFLFFYDKKPKFVHFKYVVSSGINGKEKESRIQSKASYINKAYKKLKETIGQSAQVESAQNRFLTIIKEQLRRLFKENMSVMVTYCDDKYGNDQEIKERDFKDLFHCLVIKARRDLDDTKEDKTHTLSSRLLHLVMDEESWMSATASIQQDLMDLLDGGEYSHALGEVAKQQFQEAISDIMSTNGNAKETIGLTSRAEEGSVRKLLESSATAVYGNGKEYYFSEYSQGLGYSNLTLMLIEFQQFIKDCEEKQREKTGKINFLIVEEPESHMHPQMQSIFIKHVLKMLAQNQNIACMITSHSEQMVREVPLKQIRVLRQNGYYSSIINPYETLKENGEIYSDFIKGKKNIADNEQMRRDITYLYSLNFADIVFADKAILFEGDTERMYIQALLKESENDKFKQLRRQYIAFIQVGGAYASVYIPLLHVLGIPSLIITDIDYKSKISDAEISDAEILTASDKQIETTNETLKKIWIHNDESRELSEQMHSYYTVNAKKDIVIQVKGFNNIAVVTQSKFDGFGSTLEDALLYKLIYNLRKSGVVNTFDKDDKNKWKVMKEETGLEFSIPREGKVSIRDIVKSIKKTDFMYSLILNNQIANSLPAYIEEGLLWLVEKN
ncbi:AAA family ATPase [Bifidobacterium pseudocatenulatum]|uniref:AAA family ATPase n=1 Tax=Bifidobacterium pseudocatenulatum TaxID=28026 RepID=UPI0022E59401|nr:AAA family ATPase [Bifidobacterium pseudocatenulatum]